MKGCLSLGPHALVMSLLIICHASGVAIMPLRAYEPYVKFTQMKSLSNEVSVQENKHSNGHWPQYYDKDYAPAYWERMGNTPQREVLP